MTQEWAKHPSAEVDSGASVEQQRVSTGDLPPAEALAHEVIAALVEASLVSEGDGESIRADLSSGKLDATRWKLMIENQLERKASSDDRK